MGVDEAWFRGDKAAKREEARICIYQYPACLFRLLLELVSHVKKITLERVMFAIAILRVFEEKPRLRQITYTFKRSVGMAWFHVILSLKDAPSSSVESSSRSRVAASGRHAFLAGLSRDRALPFFSGP